MFDYGKYVPVNTRIKQMEDTIMECTVTLLWDPEACVWVATSDDVPGLILESGSFDAMIERLHYVIPELLELNKKKVSICNMNFITQRKDQVAVHG